MLQSVVRASRRDPAGPRFRSTLRMLGHSENVIVSVALYLPWTARLPDPALPSSNASECLPWTEETSSLTQGCFRF
jgi:hypothetical protein